MSSISANNDQNIPFGKNHFIGSEDIRKIAEKFPYSLPIQALLSKNLKDSNKLDFDKFLKISSIISPDRSWLYNFVNSNKENPISLQVTPEIQDLNVEFKDLNSPAWVSTEILEVNNPVQEIIGFEPKVTDSVPVIVEENLQSNAFEEEIISEALDSIKDFKQKEVIPSITTENQIDAIKIQPEPEKLIENQALNPVFENSLEKEIMKVAIDKTIQREVDEIIAGELSETKSNDIEIEEVKSPEGFNFWLNPAKNQLQSREEKLKKIDALIEKFIKSEPRIVPKKVEFYSPVNIAKQSVEFNEDLVSEPLAAIFEKQGYFDKAIKAYEKLSLKFPEKRTYFATRIEKIKEIIKNIKNTK